MLTQRYAQQSLRRLAASQSFVLFVPCPSRPFPVVVQELSRYRQIFARVQTRPLITQVMKDSEENSLLAAQRRNRPIAPHLKIYRPQITWYLSAFHRITGSVLSGSLYVFATLYLVSPLFGWHLESATLAASFGALPLVVKIFAKGAIGGLFTFHSFNGLRHLMWDLRKGITNKTIRETGWIVVGLSTISTLGLIGWGWLY